MASISLELGCHQACSSDPLQHADNCTSDSAKKTSEVSTSALHEICSVYECQNDATHFEKIEGTYYYYCDKHHTHSQENAGKKRKAPSISAEALQTADSNSTGSKSWLLMLLAIIILCLVLAI